MSIRHIFSSIVCVCLAAATAVGQTAGELRATPAPPVTIPTELLNDSPAANAVGGDSRSAITLREASVEPSREPLAEGQSLRMTPSRQPAVETAQREAPTPAPVEVATAEPATAERVTDEPSTLKPFKMRGITPGDSTAAELTAAWGDQREVAEHNGLTQWRYQLDPFPVVTATIQNEIVQRIVVQLPEEQRVRMLARQMNMDGIRPGRVDDAQGDSLGLVFPERGVAFALVPPQQKQNVALGDMEVAYIVIEPISAEPFVRRAEGDLLGPCEANLRDLEQAVRLDPHDAATRHTLALFLHSLGRHEDALRAATTATQLDAKTSAYQLLQAEILGELGQADEALKIATTIAADESLAKLEQAQAKALVAEIQSRDPAAKLAETVQLRQEAIALAESLLVSETAAERRAAKRLMMSAHLGVARDVARGNFQDKKSVVPQWVTRGANFAEDLIQNEYADELLRLEVSRQAMAALQPIGGEIDPTKAVARTQENAKKLLAATEDPLRQAWVQWNLGLVLHDAMRIQYERRQIDDAEELGELAVDLLEQGSRMRQATDRETVRLGQLYFQRGAVEAVFRKDHEKAVTWFEKAAPLLDELGPDAPVENLGGHGESFVSMGVTYWSTGSQEKAMLLTQRGLRFMEQAVEQGTLPETALAVPYNNLAAMHRQLGDETKAADFSRLAEKHGDSMQR